MIEKLRMCERSVIGARSPGLGRNIGRTDDARNGEGRRCRFDQRRSRLAGRLPSHPLPWSVARQPCRAPARGGAARGTVRRPAFSLYRPAAAMDYGGAKRAFGGSFMKCAVIIPVGPGHDGLSDEAAASVEAAFRTDQGPFSDVMILRIPDPDGAIGRSKCRNFGVEHAIQHGAEWVFFLDADDLMDRDGFAVVRAHVGDFDAVFGMIAEQWFGSDAVVLREKQVGATTLLTDILLNDPYLTLQMGHFVRARVARSIPFDEAMDTGEDFKYYLELWRTHKCCKIAQPLFINRRGAHSTGPRSADGSGWRHAVTRVFGAFFRNHPIVINFVVSGVKVGFAIANPFDMIHRHYLRRMFFEQEELDYLRELVPAGSAILEIGANVGNHVVYYGLFMAPRRIIAVEPNPAAMHFLKKNVEINRLDPAIITFLECGVGDRAGSFDLSVADEANLGAARLVPAAGGRVAVHPIDDLVQERVDFIKINVEGMEMETLSGARNTIALHRPILFIEVMNANEGGFFDWAGRNDYRIAKEFPCVDASNYVAVPV
ncbi:FkbM family methyltransferase [Azospirillum brasilense]|nr:FkbM family methyltransferase [Azospirillum brasilense]